MKSSRRMHTRSFSEPVAKRTRRRFKLPRNGYLKYKFCLNGVVNDNEDASMEVKPPVPCNGIRKGCFSNGVASNLEIRQSPNTKRNGECNGTTPPANGNNCSTREQRIWRFNSKCFAAIRQSAVVRKNHKDYDSVNPFPEYIVDTSKDGKEHLVHFSGLAEPQWISALPSSHPAVIEYEEHQRMISIITKKINVDCVASSRSSNGHKQLARMATRSDSFEEAAAYQAALREFGYRLALHQEATGGRKLFIADCTFGKERTVPQMTFIHRSIFTNEVRSSVEAQAVFYYDRMVCSGSRCCRRNGERAKLYCQKPTPDRLYYDSSGLLVDVNGEHPDCAHKKTLFECTDFCGCDPAKCTQRVVQKGSKKPLVIFREHGVGFGIRTPVDIVKGEFIAEFKSLVCTSEEAHSDATYQYNMEEIKTWNSDQDGKTISVVRDATDMGNESRFFNHSCSPNAFALNVNVERIDKRFNRIAFFAQKDIEAGSEITINYFPGYSNRISWCKCGSPNCRSKVSNGIEQAWRKKT